MCVCFGLNCLCGDWVTTTVTGWMGGVGGMIVDSVAKTVVLGGLILAGVLQWKVSPTVNRIVKKILRIQ